MNYQPQFPQLLQHWWPRSRWYHLAYVLASINLFTVLVSFLVTHLLLNTYESSILSNKIWTQRIVRFTKLFDLANAVESPVRNVYKTWEIDQEREQMRQAVSAYLTESRAIRASLAKDPTRSRIEPLVVLLGNIDHKVGVLQSEANQVFDLLRERRRTAADLHIAVVDKQFAAAVADIRSLCELARQMGAGLFDGQLRDAVNLRLYEVIIGLMAIFLVLAITVQGSRLAQQIRENETQLGRLSALVEHSEDAIISKGLNGEITSWNAGAERLYGYSAREAMGKSPVFLLTSDRLDEEVAIDHEVRAGNSIQQLETIRRRKDGILVDVELTVSPVRNEQGDLIGISQIARDIRELRRWEQTLQTAKAASDTANQAKSEFLANMSHEIRTPMTAILGFTDVLSHTVNRDDEIDAVQTIRRNGEYLIELINDILDLSKIEAGRLTLESIDVSPVRLVTDVVSLMRVRARAKGLELKVHYSTPVPATIQSDPTRVRQILINLISNAIKFTDQGSVELIIRLRQELDQPIQIQFDVIDTGIGMTEEQIGRLFRPFTQADSSTTRKYGGTGLGLSICHRLVQLLGGVLTVTSQPGTGTTFTVTINTGRIEAVQLISPLEDLNLPLELATTTEAAPVKSGRILLAEDGPDNQRLIKYMLNKAGLDVTCVDNGETACELALSSAALGTPFDLIFMDMQMPILDGYSATRRLREFGYARPIIALTAHAMSGDRAKCLAAGCNDYTIKPINRDMLLRIVGEYIGLPQPGSAAPAKT